MDHALGTRGNDGLRPRAAGLLQSLDLDKFRIGIAVDEAAVAATNGSPAEMIHFGKPEVRDEAQKLAGQFHPPFHHPGQPTGVLVGHPTVRGRKGNPPLAYLLVNEVHKQGYLEVEPPTYAGHVFLPHEIAFRARKNDLLNTRLLESGKI